MNFSIQLLNLKLCRFSFWKNLIYKSLFSGYFRDDKVPEQLVDVFVFPLPVWKTIPHNVS